MNTYFCQVLTRFCKKRRKDKKVGHKKLVGIIDGLS